jgi:hypothetical protein
MAEFERPRRQVVDGTPSMVISVKRHKTFNQYGAAKVPLDEQLYRYMEKFRQFLRPLVSNYEAARDEDPTSPFFLVAGGRKVSSGYVSTLVRTTCEKTPIPIRHFTQFRKSAVTFTHRHHPHLRGKLASNMTHRLSTGTFQAVKLRLMNGLLDHIPP